MKNIVLNCILAFVCLFVAGQSFGQKTAPKKKKTDKISLQYCDDAIAWAKKLNQSQADAECRTVHQCVPCQDKITKQKTCKSVTVQPTCSSSATITKKVVKDASGEEEAGEAPPFTVEIIQETCGKGKISLDAVVMSDGQASFDKKSQTDYAFHWFINKKEAGSNSNVSCIQAEEAEVKVIKKSTGATITLYIAPPTYVEPAPSRGAPVPTIAAVYKKTGCFGFCPIYEVQFYVDGRVKWEGKMNTGTPGIKEATLDKETLAQIARVAERINFFKMDRKYPDYQVWDAPSTIIFLNLNGKEHQVQDILGAPKELKELEKLFDDIIKKQGWRTTPDKKKQKAKSAASNKN
ncbi:MAG: DUF6438 domain-containing protein [Saprospiraceae bacterium]|nr:DUF6438 domain-containing protein [Saprospiraceae bacterium]MCF8251543.1 DUF6438 domain-containing protein [Saprospiraceae bacterium]MCF8280873.1 DUF6438 domain-containing protein [Bacteroidales bacterium]MCF8310947.1 DUF6438 domain-containing protein [Saprospiraceae bacterium]MCF8439717.1 DUF6438 domain-containing protein [Saprospiraceae bacterium]